MGTEAAQHVEYLVPTLLLSGGVLGVAVWALRDALSVRRPRDGRRYDGRRSDGRLETDIH